jgi:hypothetical protein
MESALATAEEAGLDTSAMASLQEYYRRMSESSGLFDIVSALETAVSGMADVGLLDQGNFTDMATATQETYDQLKAAGFSETQILAQMGPLLAELSSAAEQFGYDLPAGLADLTDAAEEMGYGIEQTDAEILETWSEEFMAEFTGMTDAMKDFFGGLSEFDAGGIVGGAEGQKQLAFVHGGELVIPASQGVPVTFNGGGGGGQPAAAQEINISFDTKSGDPILEQLMDLIVPKMEQRSENGRIQLSQNGIKDS